MPSHDILDRLFGVEKKAEAIVSAAQEESDRRIAAANEAAEAAFKSAYEKRATELLDEYSGSEKQTDREIRDELASFTARFEATGRNKAAFVRLCDEFLAGKA